MRLIWVILCLSLPLPVSAQTAMSAAEFDAYTRGKTFTFGSQGAPYGAEEYLDNRRVRWSFLDGRCQQGVWYEAEGHICFVYEHKPDDHQCWRFEHGAGGLSASFENDPNQTQLYEMAQSDEPLMCLGPEIGV